MRRRRRRFASTVAVIVATAALAAAAPATVSGETLSCWVSAAGTFSPGMWLAAGEGTYSISGTAGLTNETHCSYNSGPSLDSAITTSGRFTNIVCGTTFFESPGWGGLGATQIDVGRDGTLEVSEMTYRLDSVSWQARLEALTVNGRATDADSTPDGVLVLRPQHFCTSNSLPLTRFTADGVFELAW